ncbi:hypothetical protein BH10BAC5_BH10BAC5_18590 [soil metagenome]
MDQNLNGNTPDTSQNMKMQIDLVIISRRIRLLGIMITVGIVMITVMGLLVSSAYQNPAVSNLNYISLAVGLLLILASNPYKVSVKKKVNASNFEKMFFKAHVIAFALCDFGTLFIVTTNLFVNENKLIAIFGAVIGVVNMILLFPKEKDNNIL